MHNIKRNDEIILSWIVFYLDKAIDLVGDLATYSITVRELKSFFSSLQRTEQMQWVCQLINLCACENFSKLRCNNHTYL